MHKYSVAVFGEEFFPHQVTTTLCSVDVATFTSVNATTQQLLDDVVRPALLQPPQVDAVLLLSGQTLAFYQLQQYIRLEIYRGMENPVYKEIKSNSALTSDVISKCQDILESQFPKIGGFQLTQMVPTYDDKAEHWKLGNHSMQKVKGPCVQIHHDGKFHWVASLRNEKNHVYLLDSLYDRNVEIRPFVAIQLCQIYGNGNSRLSVYRSNVQRQSSDTLNCGVFAIANIVEFCINGYKELENCTRTWNFDENNMRNHLVKCLEDGKFTSFPKIEMKSIFMDYDRELLIYVL